MVTIFYLVMGMFGYFSTLGRTPEIVLIRENVPGGGTDYFMMFANIGVMIVMVVNCVTNYLPFRENLYSLLFDVDDIP